MSVNTQPGNSMPTSYQISAVMAELGRRNKGIPKPKSAQNGKLGGRPKGRKNKPKQA